MEKPHFGTLVIVIDKARNLPNRKKIGKQDAYAIVRLGHEVQRTPTDKRAGQVPNWNHEIRFKVPNEAVNILKISIFNEDSKAPDLIGDCAIDLTDLYRKHEFDSWFDLKYKEKPAGEVYAELTFYYEGPPRPKPKIDELHGIPSRPASGAAISRGLPSLPHQSEGMRTPARQNSLPVRDQVAPDFTTQDYDPTYALENLSLGSHNPRAPSNLTGYVDSPYQSGVKYAETWDGIRVHAQASATPAPGDIRRKSISIDTRPTIPQSNDNLRNYPDQHTTIGQSHYDLGRDVPQYQHMANRRYSQSEMRLPANFPASIHQHPQVYSSDPQIDIPRYNARLSTTESFSRGNAFVIPSQAREAYAYSEDYNNDEVQYAEPVLDPRHGSVNEIRHSPHIISPQPEYATLKSNNTGLSQESYRPTLLHPHSELPPHNPYNPGRGYLSEVNPMQNKTVNPFSPGVFETSSHQYQRHAQAQSYSQPGQVRAHQSDWASGYHQKSASHSVAPNSESMRAHYGQMPGNPRDLPNAANVYPRGQESFGQSVQSYAPTPAQYRNQNRPLPAAPRGPPARPAKIPLGLTQEEYDLLNGR